MYKKKGYDAANIIAFLYRTSCDVLDTDKSDDAGVASFRRKPLKVGKPSRAICVYLVIFSLVYHPHDKKASISCAQNEHKKIKNNNVYPLQ